MDLLFYSGFELVHMYWIRFRQHKEPEGKLATRWEKRHEGTV